jgi:hypothetical protein
MTMQSPAIERNTPRMAMSVSSFEVSAEWFDGAVMLCRRLVDFWSWTDSPSDEPQQGLRQRSDHFACCVEQLTGAIPIILFIRRSKPTVRSSMVRSHQRDRRDNRQPEADTTCKSDWNPFLLRLS